MKTIVIGVGNPILKDDGIGIHVANKLKQIVKSSGITIDEAMTGGMNLLDLILGYDKAIIIDAVNIKNASDGEVKRFHLTDFSSVHSNNPHDVSLLEAIKLAEHLGEKRIPNEIIIIGIVLKKMPYVFGDQLSKKIADSIPKAIELTLSEIKKNMNICELNNKILT